jgi:hypothetical protein
MNIFDFNTKNNARRFEASEWSASKEIFFKTLNLPETLLINEYFETYRNAETCGEKKVEASFKMLKLALVDENGDAVLTDDDYEAVKNAPAAPIVRAWCYAMNPEYNRGETFKKK